MFNSAQKFLNKLRRCTSGNAAIVVALGMPALIGGTGYAVDTAQWYMWKREMQFAVDQAAVAGAWAMSGEDTKASYVLRAQQEFAANLAATEEFATTPAVSLQNFAGGDNNSVVVSAQATKSLPFSSFITGDAATIAVFAQASFEGGATFTSCLLAVDEHESGAITIGGSSIFTAGCGIAALSDSDEAITINGNPTIDAGWIVAAGGIDDWLDDNTDDTIMEYQDNLIDPFEDLSPPETTASQVPRTYSCPNGTTQTTADTLTHTVINYDYYKGSSAKKATPYSQIGARDDVDTQSFSDDVTVPNNTVAGTITVGPTEDWNAIQGNGKNTVWERSVATVTTTYSDVQTIVSGRVASVHSGTYDDLRIGCDTVFRGGVYVIDGGALEIHSQYDVTGSGVMFVLINGAGIIVNGGSSINLTAMTVSELMAEGIMEVDAEKLAGMLIFEDRDSPENRKNKINGNAETVLNGTVYLPVSGLTFSGTASVTSQCLMIAAAKITLTGNVEMSTFCPDGSTQNNTITTASATVKLVS